MAGKRPIDDERNELVLKELEHIHVTIARLETTIGALAANLDSVRVAELNAIRANLADSRAELTAKIAEHSTALTLLGDKASRSGAVWGTISSLVIMTIGGAVMALVLKH